MTASNPYGIEGFEQFQSKVLRFESRIEQFRQPIPKQILLVLLATIAQAGTALDLIKKAAFYGKELKEGELQLALSALRMMTHGTRHMVCPTDEGSKAPYPIGFDTIDSTRKFHALLGKITEVAEIAEELCGAITNDRRLDMVNVLEETGDGYWYDAVLYDTSGHGILDALNVVDQKLQKRYGDAYNDTGALQRNLQAERVAMENQAASTRHDEGSLDDIKLYGGTQGGGMVDAVKEEQVPFESGGGGDFGGGGASASWGSDATDSSSSADSDGGTPD